MESSVPKKVTEYLREQFIVRRRPRRKAVEMAYAYWRDDCLDEEFPGRDACFKSLERTVDRILNID